MDVQEVFPQGICLLEADRPPEVALGRSTQQKQQEPKGLRLSKTWIFSLFSRILGGKDTQNSVNGTAF